MWWYDLSNDNVKHNSNTYATVQTPLEKISVFQRGGSIVPRKLRLRRSTTQMKDDPITLTVAVDPSQNAAGELYLDDGDSFNYRTTAEYIHMALKYTGSGKKATLVSTPLHSTNKPLTASTVERVIVLGATGPATKCTTSCAGSEVALDTLWHNGQLVVKKPNCPVSASFTINFEF